MNVHKTKPGALVLLAAATLVVAACSSKSRDAMQLPPPPANYAPTLSAIADQTSDQDTMVGPIEFSVADQESAASALTVTAVADGASVVPADGVTLGGSGAMRTITVTPLEAATGAVMVTLTVTDPDGAVATRAFRLTVNARPASVRDTTLSTFAKGETDDVTVVNGLTFTQDADDAAIFEPLIGTGEE
ncbi:MAG: hypothetical protein ABI769_01190 [Pseudomonadota bacterium]